MVRKPSWASAAPICLPTPQMKVTGFGAKKTPPLALAQQGKSTRLVEVGGELRQELVFRQADRHRDADLVLDRAREAGERTGGRAAVQPLGAGKIEERLVDRQRLDQRREIEH